MTEDTDCETCGSEKEHVTCWDCGGEGGYHDCMDDCCCCLDPEDNRDCATCHGEGGYLVCPECHPESFYD